MKKRPKGKSDGPTPTAYSRALAAAIGDRRHEDLAHVFGVTPGLVSAWVTGRKPVPAVRAQPIGGELGVPPETISEAYATIARQGGGKVLSLPAPPVMRADLQVNRLENDIDSLRWFVIVLTDIMMRYRPVEAADLMETVRSRVPAKFRDNGFLLELTEAMAKQQPASAKVPAAARKRAKRQSA